MGARQWAVGVAEEAMAVVLSLSAPPNLGHRLPACLARSSPFQNPATKKKKGQAAGTTSPPDHHTCEQAAAEPAACRTCACAQCKTCAGRAGRHACLPIAQAQPIRHDANSDSRAAGDRLIDHWSWRGSPAALVSLHCSTLSASNPESFVHMELY